MVLEPLELEQVSTKYDPESRIAYITYRGALGPDASGAAYKWIDRLINEVGIAHVYGEIFDFRQVLEFLPENLMDARKKSRRMNMKNNITNLPVAMIVNGLVQVEILRGPLQNVPENARKRIVYSMDEALAFLDEWHEQNPR